MPNPSRIVRPSRLSGCHRKPSKHDKHCPDESLSIQPQRPNCTVCIGHRRVGTLANLQRLPCPAIWKLANIAFTPGSSLNLYWLYLHSVGKAQGSIGLERVGRGRTNHDKSKANWPEIYRFPNHHLGKISAEAGRNGSTGVHGCEAVCG